MFIKDQYTQEQMKALRDEAMGLRDKLYIAQQAAAETGDVARKNRIRAIEWKASARWQRRRSKAMYPSAWEYGLEGDSAVIWDSLVRGYRVEVRGAIPFTIQPEFGIFYRVIPQGRRRARTVMMTDKWELAGWARALTLPTTQEAQAA